MAEGGSEFDHPLPHPFLTCIYPNSRDVDQLLSRDFPLAMKLKALGDRSEITHDFHFVRNELTRRQPFRHALIELHTQIVVLLISLFRRGDVNLCFFEGFKCYLLSKTRRLCKEGLKQKKGRGL